MNVLHIFHEIKYSGAEIMYTDAAPVFQKLGCKLFALNTAQDLGEYTPVLEQKGYEVYHIPAYKNRLNLFQKFGFYKKVIRILRSKKIDVIHNHSTTVKWDVSLIAKLTGCRCVYTVHAVFENSGIKRLYNKWLRWSARIFFGCKFQSISDSVYTTEKRLYKNETIKIYNWYGKSRFFPKTSGEKKQIRAELNIEDDTLVLISIGACRSLKRHEHIIKSLPDILADNKDILYLHLGEGHETESEKNLAKELNVYEHIRFLGNQKDVRKYLVCSDIYLMTSEHEGISITTIEAMACKIPAILYNVPGLRDFNKDGEISILIPDDFKILAKEIVKLSINIEKQNDLAEKAILFVNKYFDMDNNVARIYKELYS